MTIWGIGVKLILFSFFYAILMSLITFLYQDLFIINAVSYHTIIPISAILLFVGIPFLVVSGRKVTKDFKKGHLITDGVFAFVRNPIYSAWIIFIIPALTLLSKSILIFSTSIFSYILFKILIKQEDLYLEQKFGEKYLKYRSQVNEIVPWFNINNET
jgi:protein-S-isoprenylcysteine O-methyltransferase Ste14